MASYQYPGTINLACERGDVAAVAAALDAGSDPDNANWGHWTPLVRAARWGHTAVVKLLLERGADANLAGVDCCTPLQAAVSGDYFDIVQLLLEHGADMVVSDVGDRSPLHIAAGKHDVRTIDALLASPSGPEAVLLKDTHGRGVMHDWAAMAVCVAQYSQTADSPAVSQALAALRSLRRAGARTDFSADHQSYCCVRMQFEEGTLPLRALEELAAGREPYPPNAVLQLLRPVASASSEAAAAGGQAVELSPAQVARKALVMSIARILLEAAQADPAS